MSFYRVQEDLVSLSLAGFDRVIAEDVTNSGRIDLTVLIDIKCYIFEFKVDTKGALEQIKEKNYHAKYSANSSKIYIVVVEFDSKDRNVVGESRLR